MNRDGDWRGALKPLAVLWLFGICLRLTVLAIPPVIPRIHETLRLSQAQVGALTSLPVLLLSFAAIPGAFLIGRWGAPKVLTLGILLAGLASALRAAAPDAFALFAATFAMGVGIAVMQPALPSIVREWLPRHIGLATAVYSNGLLVGEALAASLTLPYVLPMVGGSWRLSLVVWSVPLFAIALVAALYRRGEHRPVEQMHARERLWWPDWRSPFTWRIGFIAGGSSSLYFATVAFLPDYLHHHGRAELVGPALSAMNWMQIPASVLLLAFPQRLMRRRWPFVGCGLLALAGIVALVSARDPWLVMGAGAIGFCTAFVLILSLALPPLLVEAHDVHRVSAAMFAISYLCALVTPVIGGFLWDSTQVPFTAFLPAGAFGFVIIVLALGLDLQSPEGAARE